MYRAILPDGDIRCERYERGDHGIDLYEDGEQVAFVPYANLVAVVDADREGDDHRSAW
ncbi:MAG: hypothetical protein ABEH77_03475 [Halobacteriaceae archaeon]